MIQIRTRMFANRSSPVWTRCRCRSRSPEHPETRMPAPVHRPRPSASRSAILGAGEARHEAPRELPSRPRCFARPRSGTIGPALSVASVHQGTV